MFLAGVLGYGFYFWFSGRVWCRFACPLAALMHIYARFSRFRIVADKKKCISCNVCTSVCHQGIDVMNFANKGLPMQDPECVRCSACVQSCPTGVLAFGRRRRRRRASWVLDRLSASPVQRTKVALDGARAILGVKSRQEGTDNDQQENGSRNQQQINLEIHSALLYLQMCAHFAQNATSTGSGTGCASSTRRSWCTPTNCSITCCSGTAKSP